MPDRSESTVDSAVSGLEPKTEINLIRGFKAKTVLWLEWRTNRQQRICGIGVGWGNHPTACVALLSKLYQALNRASLGRRSAANVVRLT